MTTHRTAPHRFTPPLLAAALLTCFITPAAAQEGADAAQIEELSRTLDTLYRSSASRGTMTMTITTPQYERTLKLEMTTRGMDDTLIRILEPRKERGISTLKKGNEMWNYLPKVKKVVRIPPSMMMGSWMGSDITNDDLVRGSQYAQDYTVSLTDPPKGRADKERCLAYVPKPDAPVTWSRVTACFDSATKLPVRQEFYDEKGKKVREMRFENVREFDGRTLPTRMVILPLSGDKKGQKTVMEFDEMDFDATVDDTTFSLNNLKRGR